MNSISLKAYAKINLGLDVLGTLPDGYHEVKMVMQSISLYDKVNIKKNDSGTINVKTNLSYLPVNGDNLVYKAAYIMKEKYNIQDGFDIDLFKFIPVAAVRMQQPCLKELTSCIILMQRKRNLRSLGSR